MKDLLEKTKDILYDGIDYIIIAAIIVGVILIINWRLDGLFAENNIKASPEAPRVVAEDGSEDKSSAASENDNDEDKSLNDTSSNSGKGVESSALVELYIPAGSTSSSIGDALMIKGLIEDKSIFLQKLKESNLETRLRHGMYRIPVNSSIDEILAILTS